MISYEFSVMKLLLDIGNTCIKWAWLGDAGLVDPGECVHRGVAVEEAVAALSHFSLAPAEALAVNVAGDELEMAVAERLSDAYGVILHRVQAGAEWNTIKNGYADHGQLGADRWAAMIGAWEPQGDGQAANDLVVVDAGTAVTIDLLRADGQHLGGVILAGLQLAEAALGGETADIEDFSARSPGPGEEAWYGRSTAEAVSRGAAFSLCAAIDRAIDGFPGRSADRPPRLLLTGGDADRLLPGLRASAELRPLLVLEGLAKLAGSH